MAFEQIPAYGKIPVSGRQCPDAMQMVRQDNDGIDPVRFTLLDVTKSGSQQINLFHQEIIIPAFGEINGEELG